MHCFCMIIISGDDLIHSYSVEANKTFFKQIYFHATSVNGIKANRDSMPKARLCCMRKTWA